MDPYLSVSTESFKFGETPVYETSGEPWKVWEDEIDFLGSPEMTFTIAKGLDGACSVGFQIHDAGPVIAYRYEDDPTDWFYQGGSVYNGMLRSSYFGLSGRYSLFKGGYQTEPWEGTYREVAGGVETSLSGDMTRRLGGSFGAGRGVDQPAFCSFDKASATYDTGSGEKYNLLDLIKRSE